MIQKETENFLKYNDLTMEIQRVWNVKTNVLPVITRGNWNYLKISHKIPEIKELRTTAILGTAYTSEKY